MIKELGVMIGIVVLEKQWFLRPLKTLRVFAKGKGELAMDGGRLSGI